MKIEDLRIEIDAIDDELLRLLNRRAQLAIEVGTLKLAAGLPLYDPDREQRILTRLCHTNTGPLDHQAITKLFERIIQEARRIESHAAEVAGATVIREV
nr:chorismate mutase [Pyrinomonadaceae bacterium]